LSDLLHYVLRLRGRNAVVGSYSEKISPYGLRCALYALSLMRCSDDLERAISKLAVLGGGYRVFVAGGRKMVQSVPVEVSKDHIDLFALAEASSRAAIGGAG
jgi:hypothetical protein